MDCLHQMTNCDIVQMRIKWYNYEKSVLIDFLVVKFCKQIEKVFELFLVQNSPDHQNRKNDNERNTK